MGCLSKAFMVCVAAILGAIWLSSVNDRRNRPPQEPTRADALPVRAGAPISPRFPTGAEIELIGPREGTPMLCANEEVFLAYRSKTRNFVAGKEVFGVVWAALAQVLVDKGDRLQVKVVEGPWKDRIGWIASDQVRSPPTPEEAAKDVVDGLTLDKRREIYAQLHRIGMLAEIEGFHQFPIEGAPATFQERTAKRDALISGMEQRGRAYLIAKYKQYGVGSEQLDRIDKEGAAKRWPVPDVENPYKH
jgi:hypothetical protein